MQNSRIKLEECPAQFQFVSFSKVIIYVYGYRAIDIHRIDCPGVGYSLIWAI